MMGIGYTEMPTPPLIYRRFAGRCFTGRRVFLASVSSISMVFGAQRPLNRCFWGQEAVFGWMSVNLGKVRGREIATGKLGMRGFGEGASEKFGGAALGEDGKGLAELGGFAVQVVMLGSGFGGGEGLGAVAAVFVLEEAVGFGEEGVEVGASMSVVGFFGGVGDVHGEDYRSVRAPIAMVMRP
jgi:hypothetical protein